LESKDNRRPGKYAVGLIVTLLFGVTLLAIAWQGGMRNIPYLTGEAVQSRAGLVEPVAFIQLIRTAVPTAVTPTPTKLPAGTQTAAPTVVAPTSSSVPGTTPRATATVVGPTATKVPATTAPPTSTKLPGASPSPTPSAVAPTSTAAARATLTPMVTATKTPGVTLTTTPSAAAPTSTGRATPVGPTMVPGGNQGGNPADPALNQLVNPCFTGVHNGDPPGWQQTAGWDVSMKASNPCEPSETAGRINDPAQAGESAPDIDERIWQVVPGQGSYLVAEMQCVHHFAYYTDMNIYGGASPNGPWVPVWKPFTLAHCGQDQWGALQHAETHLAQGYAYYRIEFAAMYAIAGVSEDAGGVKFTNAYFASGTLAGSK
jgi:hypothetical protein